MHAAGPFRVGPQEAVRSRGVVLLTLMIALVLAGIALMGALDVWSMARQRSREQELLFVGDQYQQAIRRYYFGAPVGSPRTLPANLADLLEDDRYPVPVRHLRRLYPDPMTGGNEWGVLRVGDRIAGVYSLSDRTPIKQAGFAPTYQHFSDSSAYRKWVFGHLAAALPPANPAAALPGDAPPVNLPPPPPRRPPS